MENMDLKCPKCGKDEIEEIDSWTTEYRDITLYQCPKCNKVVTKNEGRGWED